MVFSPSFDRLTEGDTILITGVSGLLGSATAKEALQQGFRVRGITRDPSKLLELQSAFDQDFGDRFQVCGMDDLTKAESYAPHHLQGVSGVLHIANDASCDINKTVAATVGLMREAAKIPSVKAFTLTSSRAAAFDPPPPGERLLVSSDTFLHDAVYRARSAPADGYLAYQASKVESEKAAWDVYRKEGLGSKYAFNTILPDWVNGAPVNPRPGFYSTYTGMTEFYSGSYGPTSTFYFFTHPPSTCVALRDVAALHVISLAAGEVDRERLFATQGTWCAADVVQAITKVDVAWTPRRSTPRRHPCPAATSWSRTSGSAS
ncbi:aldehyde reductase [Apiospora hydei]|uniref:Aldehyde reductase n=1 Tax=Apiospora hydei TaxID=1337664 RepID=A0ABR1W7N9_9PEZI